MKVVFEHGGKEGMLHYDEHGHQVMVSHPNKKVSDIVKVYLNKERDFVVSGEKAGNTVGNRMIISGRATDNPNLMGMALSEMRAHTDISVKWDDPRNRDSMSVREHNMEMINQHDKNAKADKPIIKSLDDDTDYEIIN
jgi:hypothetical protein